MYSIFFAIDGVMVQQCIYVLQCLHDVTSFGVMNIWWCKNCTKFTQKIVCNTIKKHNISVTPTPTSTWNYIYEAVCNMTPYIHDTITSHTHYTTYSLHHVQQISATIYKNTVHTLQHTTIEKYIQQHHKSLTWCISYIIYLSHHISITSCESHIAICPFHHSPNT